MTKVKPNSYEFPRAISTGFICKHSGRQARNHRLEIQRRQLSRKDVVSNLHVHGFQSVLKSQTWDANDYKFNYDAFKIFSRFWLVKTTRIIHHNQVLFAKFGKHLRHIESMTSKVERIENYWTNDVKMTSKVQPAADYSTIGRENLGTRLCYIWWAEKLRA